MATSPKSNARATFVLLRRSCLGAIAIALCYPAIAAAQTTDTSPKADESRGNETIIVTARKQSEDVQNVPVAISVLSADEIGDNRVHDVAKLGELVPGLITGGSQQRGSPIIRGITTRTPEAGADSVVGQYIDEVYQPRITSQFTALLDLERIEVLKGPQGTLYGRNTIGGVINYVTRKPGQTTHAYFQAGAGNRGLLETRGGISGPISSTLAVGVTGMVRTSDGNIDVVDATGKKIGDDGSTDWGVRGALNWQPTDRLDVNVSASHIELRGASLDMVTGLPAGTIGPIVQSIGLYTPSPYTDDNAHYRIARTTAGHLDRTTTEAVFRLDYSLTDSIKLTSLSSYQHYDLSLVNDLDYDVQQIELFNTDEKSDTYSTELRLSGKGRVLQWTLGAFYFYDDLNHVEMDDFTGSPVSFIISPPFPSATSRVKTTSAAVFGQGDFSITDQLTLTAGGRYSYDKREYRRVNANQFPGFENFDSADPSSYSLPGGATWDTSPSSDDFSYLVSLGYQVTSKILVYASHSTGYRSGGIQGRSSSAAQAAANYDPEQASQYEIGFKSRLLDNRVILNVAAYRIDYKDAQINQIPLNSPFDIIRNAAGARFQGVEVEGMVFFTNKFFAHLGYTYNDSKFTRFSDADDIPGVIASLDFDGDGVPDCPGPFYGCAVNDHIYDGVPFEFAVKHSFLIGLDYEHDLGGGMTLDLNAAYAWRDAHLLTPLPRSVAGRSNSFLNANHLRQPAYGIFNARATLGIGERWSISVWGRNLTNEQYLTQGGDPQPSVDGFPYNSFLTGDRRTYGLELNWRF